ncbi:protein RER1B-like [Dendrobium catenatum]|uniref:Protein RER1 n=1 Tax=Dendrobium catenatum TaxID=906689 RepID=A0A2I0WQL5_9ASPA|nr:protein RER1B-like [Dendrobium catenatum]PKU77962.1 Protein RER1B [Dendrobium catenatum]
MEGALGGDPGEPTNLAKWKSDFSRSFQFYLDRSTPHPVSRWLGTLGIVAIYSLRVYLIQGFYIVTYGLGIYLLNLLIGFLSPIVDPVIEGMEGASLPTRVSDEFKPFIRRLPEFKFWYAITKAFCIAFVMTFFSVFDVPVFWPILLCYWIVLFFLTMKRQIMHMIKYKYIPFTTGKQKYTGKKATTSSSLFQD